MAIKLNAGVPIEEVAKYFAWFFPSLKQQGEIYTQVFFTDSANVPDHLAYLCPMCLKQGIILLPEEKDLSISIPFSQDHFPPKSVGGKHTMLVCRVCNSNAGGAFDFALKEQISRMGLENKIPLSRVKADTTITGMPGNYGGSFSIDEKGETVLGFNAEGNKKAIFLNKWLNEPEGNWEAKVTIRNPDEDKMAKALVRAAYLFCFGTWGYEFAFSRSAEMIRKYLAGGCEYPVKVPLAWLGEKLNSDEPASMPVGVCQILQPIEARCFLVNIVLIDTETGFKEIAAIPLPNPTVSGWEDLGHQNKVFKKLLSDNTLVTFNHADQYTLQKGVLDGYTQSWEYLCSLQV